MSYGHSGNGVTADLQTPSNNTGTAAGDKYLSIENLIGSNFADTLRGDGSMNVLEGGLGDDTLDGGNNIDTASYEHAPAGAGGVGVTVDLTQIGSQNTGTTGQDTLLNIENLRGSSFDDTLTGNADSVLEGGAGADHLYGNGNTTASYEHASGPVTADLLTPSNNTGDAAGDIYTNIRNLTGSNFSDHLTGDNNDNTLDGRGNQGLTGDVLTGNGGADTFVFHGGSTTITDFTHGVDHIDLQSTFGMTEPELAALIAHSTGDNIDFGNSQSLTFTNINNVSTHLSTSDFILHP